MHTILMLLVVAVGSAIGKGTMEGEGSSWYAPSRRASLYADKYQGQLEQLMRVAARQGEDNRLPRDILPISYNIRLLPFIDVGNFTTDGYIEILVECKVATRNISMNAAELTIDWSSVKVVDTANEDMPLQQTDYSDEQYGDLETISIQMEDNLVVGKQYRISMNFVSILNDELRGFYRSSYEENGVTKYLAVSQMEAPDARRAFPCFDEPNMKATFNITLGYKDSMFAISNMPLAATEPIEGMPGYSWNHFEPSVEMSSYLVAMMVSEFVNVTSEPELSPGVEFKIWARSSFRDQTAYAANIGPRILEDYVNKYFDIEFPLPKLDMAAIPDFAAGAMENWGLITYREADLLFDPVRSSAVSKQRVATIIAHELAHQWFGNLVTMDWWNVLWLNEGFASYMEYPGTDFVEPGFEINEQFTVADLHYVFGIDSFETSRPIDFQVNTPDEINQMFDAISYEKGSCVIRMCANFMGEPTFRRGVTRYLNTHSFGNTVQEDLWRALQEQADEEGVILPTSIKTIMDTWTRQMGYPVINVTRTYDLTQGAYISQERFLLYKSEGSTNSKSNYRWWVPLTYTSNFSHPESMYRNLWLTNNDGSNFPTTLYDSSPDGWVVFNVGQEGYYRVLYDQRNIELIQAQLMSNHKAISNKNRAQIIDDYLNLARANLTMYETALELTRYLKHERDYAPWMAASVALDYIDTVLYSLPDESRWKTYMESLVTDLYDNVGYDEKPNDSHLKILTRSQAINWACGKLGMADCIKNAQKNYLEWMADDKKELPPNLRRQIACAAIEKGNRSHWEFGYDKYLKSNLGSEKIELLRATTCTIDKEILNEMLKMMIDPKSGIRLQDALTVFSNIAANPVGHQVALDFLTNRWNDVYEYFRSYQGFGGSTMTRLFRALCNRVNTQAKLDQLTKLFDENPDVLGSSKTVKQGMEWAQSNVLWIGNHYSTVVNWLKIQTDPSTTSTTMSSTTPTTPLTTNPMTDPMTDPSTVATTDATTHPSTNPTTDFSNYPTTYPTIMTEVTYSTVDLSTYSTTAIPPTDSTTYSTTYPTTAIPPTDSTTYSMTNPTTTINPTNPTTAIPPTDPPTYSTTYPTTTTRPTSSTTTNPSSYPTTSTTNTTTSTMTTRTTTATSTTRTPTSTTTKPSSANRNKGLYSFITIASAVIGLWIHNSSFRILP